MKQVGAYVTDKLHLQFKLACVRANKSMGEVIREMIIKWVEEQEMGKADEDVK